MAQQGPEPEWQGLINQLASLGDFNDNFKQGVEAMQNTVKENVSIMQNVNTILVNLKKRVSGTLIETTKIIEALKTGSDAQKINLNQLESYRNQLTADINELDTQIKIAKTNTYELNNSLGQNPQQPAIGGKRRRRTRNKGKKYHKRTKRGGYTYGEKKKEKKSPKKK